MQNKSSASLLNTLCTYMSQQDFAKIEAILKDPKNAEQLRSIINQENDQGQTLLSLAVRNINDIPICFKMIDLLVEKGANISPDQPNSKNNSIEIALDKEIAINLALDKEIDPKKKIKKYDITRYLLNKRPTGAIPEAIVEKCYEIDDANVQFAALRHLSPKRFEEETKNGADRFKGIRFKRNALFSAIKYSAVDFIKFASPILTKNDFKSLDALKRTPLMAAAKVGNLDMVKALIEADKALIKAEESIINTQNPFNATALMVAAERGHVEVVRYLLKHGAKPNAFTTDGQTALTFAAAKGHTEIVTALLAAGARPELSDGDAITPLMFAAQYGHTKVVKTLLANSNKNIDALDDFENTALRYAVRNGHTEVVKTLMDFHADPEASQTLYRKTALMDAAENGHTEMVKILLSRADPTATDWYGQTALMYAAANGHLGVVEALVAAGANIINATDQRGKTALMLAAANGHLGVVKALLQKSPNINARDGYFGSTALMCALKNGHTELAQTLLKHQAQVTFTDILYAFMTFQFSLGLELTKLARQKTRFSPSQAEQDAQHTEVKKDPSIHSVADGKNINFPPAGVASRSSLSGEYRDSKNPSPTKKEGQPQPPASH